LPEIHLIDPWLLGEEWKTIMVCGADKTLPLVFSGTLDEINKSQKKD
jgi:hypothetical protein